MRTLLFLAALAAAGCPDVKTPTDPRFTPGIAGPVSGNRLPEPAAVPAATDGKPGEYFFCFWNVENLFDDQDDNRTTKGDKEFEGWFAQEKDALKQKLDNIAEVVLGMNGGKGPDILCLAEVESGRAAELVQQTLNARLKDRN